MILVLLILLPAILGLLVLATQDLKIHLTVAGAASAFHLILVLSTWIWMPEPLGNWLQLDELGRLFLTVTSVLFAGVMVYTSDYLLHGTHDDIIATWASWRFFLPKYSMVWTFFGEHF